LIVFDIMSSDSPVRKSGKACLVPWAGGTRAPDAFFGFYLRKAFQSQTNTKKILYNESR